MLFATPKDIQRAKDLGLHKGYTHMDPIEIRRSKANSGAQLITNPHKILGRLEAMISQHDDFHIINPYISRCSTLLPGSQYDKAEYLGKQYGAYVSVLGRRLDIRNSMRALTKSKDLIINVDYEFDELAWSIFWVLAKYYVN